MEFRLHRVVSFICLSAIFLTLPVGMPELQPQVAAAHADITPGQGTHNAVSKSRRGVLLRWQGEVSRDNLGFNIYRLSGGERVKINREIIPGSAFAARAPFHPLSRQSYSFFDKSGSADATYVVEAVGVDGGTEILGSPISIAVGDESLSDEVATAQGESSKAVGTNNFPAALDQSLAPAGAVEDQWSVAGQAGVKIAIKKDGWYRVTHGQITAAGFNPSVDVRNLRLFGDGKEVSILTSKFSGNFAAGDYFEFYGRGRDTATTDTRTYYLIAGATAGKRIRGDLHTTGNPNPPSALPHAAPVQIDDLFPMSKGWYGFILQFINGLGPTANTPSTRTETISAPTANPISVEPPAADSEKPKRKSKKRARKDARPSYHHAISTTATNSFDQTIEIKERLVHFFNLLNGEKENYFGSVIIGLPGASVTKTLTLTGLDTAATKPARLELSLQGGTPSALQLDVSLNNVSLGTMSFSGVQSRVQRFEIPVSGLVAGANQLKLTNIQGGFSLIDYVRLVYPRSFRAENNQLRLGLPRNQTVSVENFSTQSIRVLDFTDPFDPTLTRPGVASSGGGFAITITNSADRSKARLVYAFPDGHFETPAGFTLNEPSTLNATSNGAANLMVVIGHKSLLASLTPLVTLRQNQGLTIKVVDVEDVYDEFDYGIHGPYAIRNFLSHAFTSWQGGAPDYLMLLGDASHDPRNYEGVGDLDFVPTKLVDATFNETSSDDWFADFNDDGLPSIPTGRLPVRTLAQANLVIGKIVGFVPSNVPQSALLVADDPTNYYFNFETANDEVEDLLPASVTVQKVYRRIHGNDSNNVISKINAGQMLVNYSGHGNVDTWTSAPIFTSSQASALNNGNKLPFVVVMDCLNGLFQDPRLEGIAEALMKANNGGSVAAFASSGLTIPDGQHAMSEQLYSLIFGAQPIALGDAIKNAKAATNDIDVRRTWIFFGDPSMRIR